jgi:hypothetical protein
VWSIQYEDNELVSASRGTHENLPLKRLLRPGPDKTLEWLWRSSLIYAPADTTVKVWDLRAGKSRMTLRGA